MKVLRLAAALALAAAPAFSAVRPAVRPNVLFIVVDDLNVDLGTFGHAVVRTPHIDRLVSRGVRFDRAYCQFPLCSPSRESFLSGRRPETSGALVQGRTVRSIDPAAVYLPGLFRAHGYFTAGAGKVFHKNDAASWDRYDEAETNSPQEREALMARAATRQRGENAPEWRPLDCPDADTGDGIIARRVAAWMREAAAAGKPFFLAAGFRKPHLPWTAPRAYFDLYPRASIPPLVEPPMRDIPPIALQTDLFGAGLPEPAWQAVAAYYACVTFIDAQVGVLTETLGELKLWENTIIVLVGDHGFHLGDHGGLWAKLTDFERAARVPLAIVTPRSRHAGRASPGIVESLDLYPTLAELAGLPRPAGLEGRSLVPLLNAPDAPWDSAGFTTTIHQGIIGRSVRTPRWRYTEWGDGFAAELYDHDADPGEYTNLAAHPARAADIAALKQLLARNPRLSGPTPADAQSPRQAKKTR